MRTNPTGEDRSPYALDAKTMVGGVVTSRPNLAAVLAEWVQKAGYANAAEIAEGHNP